MHSDPRHELRPLTTTQRAMLLANLNPNRVQSRKAPGGGNKSMSYLAAWDVRATLIKVFGFGGFSVSAEDTKIIKVETDLPRPNGRPTPFRVTVQVTTSLYIHQLGAIYTGVALASQSGSDIGEVADFAAKTADSDAFKRAAMNLGTQFGLSLYNNGSPQDVVVKVLAPDQNNRAMRLRTIEENAVLQKIEGFESDVAAGVVVDADEIKAAYDVNILGDADAQWGEDTVQHAGQPNVPAPTGGRQAPDQPQPPTEPPSNDALDAIAGGFKQ